MKLYLLNLTGPAGEAGLTDIGLKTISLTHIFLSSRIQHFWTCTTAEIADYIRLEYGLPEEVVLTFEK